MAERDISTLLHKKIIGLKLKDTENIISKLLSLSKIFKIFLLQKYFKILKHRYSKIYLLKDLCYTDSFLLFSATLEAPKNIELLVDLNISNFNDIESLYWDAVDNYANNLLLLKSDSRLKKNYFR